MNIPADMHLNQHLPSENEMHEMAPALPEAMAAPRMTAEEGRKELASLSERERRSARADVLGRQTPAECVGGRMEEAVDALEVEMGRLCNERHGDGGGDCPPSLLLACRSHPFLASSSHARLFLIVEDLDSERAARRMARYWEGRERLHGDAAFEVDPTVVPPDEEIARLANRGPAAGRDNTDAEVRRAMARFLRNWEDRKQLEMGQELEKIPLSCSKAAFVDAQKRSPDVVDTAMQRRLFLQGADYDPKVAARRMVNYWDLKYHLFGADNALGDVFLTATECPQLSDGVFYCLPGTDAFGRGIICYRLDKLPHNDRAALKKVLQVAWYALHLAMANKAIMRKGIVLIVVAKGIKHFPNVDFIHRMAVLLLKSIPLRLRATHVCMAQDSWWFRIAMSVVTRVIGREGRSRILVHRGEQEDVLASLEDKFGISRGQLPSFIGGILDQDYTENWIEQQGSERDKGVSVQKE